MKSITEFIKENINESHSNFDIEDVIMSIENVCDGNDWTIDPNRSRKGTFADAVKANGSIYDVLEFHTMFGDLADDLGCDEDELMDFIYDNNDELMQEMGIK